MRVRTHHFSYKCVQICVDMCVCVVYVCWVMCMESVAVAESQSFDFTVHCGRVDGWHMCRGHWKLSHLMTGFDPYRWVVTELKYPTFMGILTLNIYGFQFRVGWRDWCFKYKKIFMLGIHSAFKRTVICYIL